ncbi:hypothetical protein NBT05_06750 [Aquimarina sp. ERC-38]|uniref:hypothetical protein n=1 Tax=Aquimarina sp. ERC-38 TaxID=2949996 RepID=UPI00224823D5|nr:hypothetical protein [Aquimarina sp. ERC-38]UZO82166.1 hypothetical protein NBT05_06750 [Aquimarina sp. ERC-38]
MKYSKAQKVLEATLREAWTNPSFKENLIANPIPEIEKLTGEKINVPVGKMLVVIDQTDTNTIYLILPPQPDFEDIELDEAQLEIIAGGGGVEPVITGLLPTLNGMIV